MKIIKVLALAFAMLVVNGAYADTWPSRPIRFIVGFGPGGANDLVARAVAEAVSKQLGQPIIVENKPGAGSVVGGDYVAKSAPDGYTFYAGAAGGVVTIPMLRNNMPYKPEDLVPVGMMAVSPSIIVVNSDSPIRVRLMATPFMRGLQAAWLPFQCCVTTCPTSQKTWCPWV